jgi:TonB family protein
MEVTLTNSNNKKIAYGFLGVSLFTHIFFMFMSVNVDHEFKLSDNSNETVIKVKLQNFNKKINQIATTEQSKINKAKDAKFLSNKNNTFDRETKSTHNGSFQAASKGVRNARNNKDSEVNKKSLAKKFENIKFSDLAMKSEKFSIRKKVKKVAKQSQTKRGLKNGYKKGIGLGQTNDHLEDIPLGDFTRLNTQEYEYYGFYHRIRQKLEQFWGSNIQEQADKIFKAGRSIATESNLVTGLTIKLNAAGEIVDIVLKSTSGVKELDDAAVESFNQAGPFPNPPKGMIKADGKASIEWGFVVNT